MVDDDEDLPPWLGERLRDITHDLIRNETNLRLHLPADREQPLRDSQ